MEENKRKMSLITFILVFFIVLLVAALGLATFIIFQQKTTIEDLSSSKTTDVPEVVISESKGDTNVSKSPKIEVKGDEVSSFDLSFLKEENPEENMIYSPLSIKYTLSMLESGANGNSKSQISSLLGTYTLLKHNSSENMSFANAMFIKDTFKDSVKESYIDTLKQKFDADVKLDSFENAENINNWIKNTTFDIIPEIVDDDSVSELDFALINALAIDMDWADKFIDMYHTDVTFEHERRSLDQNLDWREFEKKGLTTYPIEMLSSNTFYNGDEELEVSGMKIAASINNYNIVKILGEDYIKKTVSDEYRKFAKDEEYDTVHAYGDFTLSDDTSDAGIEKDLEEFLPQYIEELDSNYHKYGSSVDFSFYVDDDVKVFAKDLKEYDGVTLQYVGIMPTTKDLNKFVDTVDSKAINEYIENLKEIKPENFKEGVFTKIYGFIPKFNFEYDLDLLKDLEKLDITDIFDSEKADLSNMIDAEDTYISTALHKANIEFTEDGIKAAAATFIGGRGAGDPFNYLFDVPVEEIDLTFDKPFMFLIRDKETGEVWFVGNLYKPLLWEAEANKGY